MNRLFIVMFVAVLSFSIISCSSNKTDLPPVIDDKMDEATPESTPIEEKIVAIPPAGGDGIVSAATIVKVFDEFVKGVPTAEKQTYTYDRLVEMFGGVEGAVSPYLGNAQVEGEHTAVWSDPNFSDDDIPKLTIFIFPGDDGKFYVQRAGSMSGISADNYELLKQSIN